jgi:hypothetical protein
MKEAKTTRNYMYLHRLMRLWSYLRTVEVNEGLQLSDLMSRSCMISNLCAFTYSQKLHIEAATLSYLPQFTKWNGKEVQRLFGGDVRNLVKEINALRSVFTESGDVDINDIKGFSFPAKTIYVQQCYVDMVIMLTTKKIKMVLDGKVYVKKDGKVNVDGEWFAEPQFHQWFMETLIWKINIIGNCAYETQQAIQEAVKLYKEQKGFEFDLNLSFADASSDRSPINVED